MRGQHPRVDPLRRKAGEGGQLLGPRGQQDVARLLREERRGLRAAGYGEDPLGRAVLAAQAQKGHAGLGAGRAEVAVRLRGIGVRGVDADPRPAEQRRHARRVPPADEHGNARRPCQHLRAQGRCDAHRDAGAARGEEGGELPPLGRAAEEQDGLVPHGRAAPSGPRYPRGVTMRPAMQRVVALPMKTVVNMSSASWRRAESGRMRDSCPGRPMLRTQPQTVSGGSFVSRTSHARRRASLRPREAGLYRQRRKPASAAQGEPRFDLRPGRQPVGEGDGAEVVAERRAQHRRAGERRRDPGHHLHKDARKAGRELQQQARHAVDARVPAADHGDRAALRRLLQRVEAAVALLRHGRRVPPACPGTGPGRGPDRWCSRRAGPPPPARRAPAGSGIPRCRGRCPPQKPYSSFHLQSGE